MAKGTMSTCPECGTKVAKDNLKGHQRRVHGGEETQRTQGPQRDRPIPAAQGFPWGFVAVGLVVAVVVSAALYLIVLAPPSGDDGGDGTGGAKTIADVSTSYGTFVIELYTAEAPVTTGNFITHAQAGHYDGSTFHRVVPDFVIQGGQLAGGVSNPTIPWEDTYSKGMRNGRYTVAMARSGNANTNPSDRNTATSQFFVNVKVGDNAILDPPSQTYAYVVFGKVIQGTSVVDAIAGVQVTGETPNSTISINSITIRTVP